MSHKARYDIIFLDAWYTCSLRRHDSYFCHYREHRDETPLWQNLFTANLV